MSTTSNGKPFKTMELVDVPHFRNGKHKKIVSKILSNLEELRDGGAIKIPLAELGDTKENVRSALNRVTRKASLRVGTAADENFLYVWNIPKDSKNGVRR
jgi:hypothetical protein